MKQRTKKSNSPLKIAFVLDDGLDSSDGVQQYIRSLGSWLTTQGHEVHYLVGETKQSDIDNVYSLAKNIKVTFNGNGLSIPLPASGKKIRQLLKAKNYDILHVQVPYSPFFGEKVILQAPKDSVIIGTFHILPYGRLAEYGTQALGYLLYRSKHRFDAHFAVSDVAKKFAMQRFGINASVLPNVVDIEKFIPSKPIKHFESGKTVDILFLGRLVERKGCGYLLDALADLHRTYPQITFRLTICGKGPLRDKLEEQGVKLRLADRVHFTGFVSDEEKITFMQRSDIAIFPSTAGESFGIVLIEAMAAGAGVVIGGDNPGYRSVLGSVQSSIVDVRDSKIFAESIAKIIVDENHRSRIHKEQQKLVTQFDVNVVGKQLLTVYQDCKNASAGR